MDDPLLQRVAVCPACYVPVRVGGGTCDSCGAEYTAKSARTMSIEELVGLEKKACPSCWADIPKLATRCGSCRAALDPRQPSPRPLPPAVGLYFRRASFDDCVLLAALTRSPPTPAAARAAIEAAGFRVTLWVPAVQGRCPRATWEVQAWIQDPEGPELLAHTSAGQRVGEEHHIWLEGPGADLRAAELVDLPAEVADTFRGSALLGIHGHGGARGLAFYDQMLRVLRALAPGAELLDTTAGRVPPDGAPTALEDAYGLHVAFAGERAWICTLGLRVFGLPELERFVASDEVPAAVARLRAVAEGWHASRPTLPGAPLPGDGEPLTWQPWEWLGPDVARGGPGGRAEVRARLGGASAVMVPLEDVGQRGAEPSRPSAGPSPVFAALASLLLPGLGQVLNGQIGKGVLVAVLALFTLSACGLVNVLAAAEAWATARRAHQDSIAPRS